MVQAAAMEAQDLRHLRTLAAAVLKSELPWQELHRALLEFPSTCRVLRENMWPHPVNGVQVAVEEDKMDQWRPEYEIAIDFLRLKTHAVGDFSTTTCACQVDDLVVSDLGLICLAQTYRREWLDFLKRARAAEREPRPAHAAA